nr:cationic amino acid transporter 6, chloroplastic-like isoform X2 [Ipomoea trifida]
MLSSFMPSSSSFSTNVTSSKDAFERTIVVIEVIYGSNYFLKDRQRAEAEDGGEGRYLAVGTTLSEAPGSSSRGGGSAATPLEREHLWGGAVAGEEVAPSQLLLEASPLRPDGHTSHDCEGPIVVLSFAIAGLCTIIDYVLSNAAVTKSNHDCAVSAVHLFLAIDGLCAIIDYVLSNAAVTKSFKGFRTYSSKAENAISALPKG